MELPPRARRIHIHATSGIGDDGTTSACAENTPGTFPPSTPGGNYLRMRGEYGHAGREGFTQAELPPHARRILKHCLESIRQDGTTSACAENTAPHATGAAAARNYLRMRGEYCTHARGTRSHVELPPHARRIPEMRSRTCGRSGTTSACAENTGVAAGHWAFPWNYLRMRGEYLIRLETLKIGIGTTSACAENT